MEIGQALESLTASHRMVTDRLAKLLEATDYTQMIDPRDAYVDDNGEVWAPVGYGTGLNEFGQVYRSEGELDRVRNLCRWFADENEFAINSHENRVSYVVGWGHLYRVASKPGEDVSDNDRQAVQEVVDQFLRINHWSPSYVCRDSSGRPAWGFRQSQNVKRRDRDGEVFLRKFNHEDGILRVRYLEPEAVRTPQSAASRHNAWGIVTDPDDAETVVAYHVNGQDVPAESIQHRTRDGSPQNPRGVPIHYAVRKNLLRAQKILRNGSTVTEIQAAIAMIRKHAQATKATVQALVSAAATSTTTDADGRSKYRRKYDPGTILDASANVDYQFPGMGIDPSKYVASLQAELRAVAARLVMPEFMLTSDASNANFSSTMVAEGPAVKMFQRLQWDEISFDVALIWDALHWAAESGLVPEELLQRVDIQAEAPIVQSRDRLKDAQMAQILDTLGYLSPQTGSAQFDLDYEQEQDQREQHNERMGLPPTGIPPQLVLPPAPGEDDPDAAASAAADPEQPTPPGDNA